MCWQGTCVFLVLRSSPSRFPAQERAWCLCRPTAQSKRLASGLPSPPLAHPALLACDTTLSATPRRWRMGAPMGSAPWEVKRGQSHRHFALTLNVELKDTLFGDSLSFVLLWKLQFPAPWLLYWGLNMRLSHELHPYLFTFNLEAMSP